MSAVFLRATAGTFNVGLADVSAEDRAILGEHAAAAVAKSYRRYVGLDFGPPTA
jgi:hypothetical protein